MLDHLTKVLLAAAIIGGFGAIIRFEVLASNTQNFKNQVKENFVKKEEFIAVKTELKDLKEDTREIKQDIKQLLRKMK